MCCRFSPEDSLLFQDLHELITVTYGLPDWASYTIFGLATVLTGLFLGMVSCPICDSPWESREKGERTGTRAMTRHAKRVTSLSDMRICNKQNKECHGRYCFSCSSFCPKQ